jgi:hypothetical protein
MIHSYCSYAGPTTQCGDDSDIYIYDWSLYEDFGSMCHHISEVILPKTDMFDATVVLNTSVSAGGTGPKGKVHCFAGTEVVTLENGELRAMYEVKLGDSILSVDARTGLSKYSKVIALPHVANADRAQFTRLVTASGKDIKLTADHLISCEATCDSNKQPTLMLASEVTEDMCLVHVEHGFDKVTAVQNVMAHSGIYSVVAEEEYIVVNGFVASPFAVNHAVSNAYYNVIRAFPLLGKLDFIRSAGEYFGKLVDMVSN